VKTARIWAVGVLLLCACRTSVGFNPEGLFCDEVHACAPGLVCVANECKTPAANDACAQSDVCPASPEPQCEDSSTLLSYPAAYCQPTDGSCVQPSTRTLCAQGCQNSRCVGEPCKGIYCDRPPAAQCVDTKTLRRYGQGSCAGVAGECRYTASDVVCATECLDGVCQGEPCAGASCDQPPPSVCVGTSLRVYEAAGTCTSNGTCRHEFSDSLCPHGCNQGACLSPPLTFSQTLPGLPSGITAIDQAPGNLAGHALAVGPNGFAARWNGTTREWTRLETGTTEDLTAVWLKSDTVGTIVGNHRTVLRYDGKALSKIELSGGPDTDLVAVHGAGSHPSLIVGKNGALWMDGVFKDSGFTEVVSLSSGYVTPEGQYRAAGECVSGPCVLYASNKDAAFYLDGDPSLGAGGFRAVGPGFLSTEAFLGWGNSVVSHDTSGNFVEPSVSLVGANVVGLCKAETGASTTKAVYALTSPSQSVQGGRLYRLTSTGGEASLAVTTGEHQALAWNDVGGALVADSFASSANVFRRSPTSEDIWDLGEDWVAASATGTGTLVLMNAQGDLGIRDGSGLSLFRRKRDTAMMLDVAATESYALLVGERGRAFKWQPDTGFVSVPPPVAGASLRSICKAAGDLLYVVGDGAAALFDGSQLKPLSLPGAPQLSSVSCGPGGVVAVSREGGVFRVEGNALVPVVPAFPTAAALFTAWQDERGSLWVSGDKVVGRLEGQSWMTWRVEPSISRLLGNGAGDLYGVSGPRVLRYDGAGWRVSFTAPAPLGALTRSGGKVWAAGNGGVVVVGQ
jgi:hypothetical protein